MGGIGRIIKKIAIDGEVLAQTHFVAVHIFGVLGGLLLVAIAYSVPIAVTLETNVDPHPVVLVFLGLLGGLFSRRVFNAAERKLDEALKD